MNSCPRCKSKNLRKELENVYEIEGTKYFDYNIICMDCLHRQSFTTARKSPVPKAKDKITAMTASIKLRKYFPERGEPLKRKRFEGLSLRKVFSPFKHLKEILLYSFAIFLGLLVEIGGIYFERYLIDIRIDPLAGFLLSLLIFLFAPILVVGSFVYYVTKDRLKAVLVGSAAIPLTIIFLSRTRLSL